MCLTFHHNIGDISGDILSHLRHQVLLEHAVGVLLALLGDLLLQIGLELLEGIKL